MTNTDSKLYELAGDLGRLLHESRLVLTTAESCTGGWVAECVTDVPGSSAWFDGGFITYSNAAKEAMLGVPAELLAAHGAVSEPVASAMAAGALQSGRADLAVAITGIAGPTGGTAEKPVGMVCFAFQRRAEPCTTSTQFFKGNRREIRQQAVEFALQGLLLACRNQQPAL